MHFVFIVEGFRLQAWREGVDDIAGDDWNSQNSNEESIKNAPDCRFVAGISARKYLLSTTRPQIQTNGNFSELFLREICWIASSEVISVSATLSWMMCTVGRYQHQQHVLRLSIWPIVERFVERFRKYFVSKLWMKTKTYLIQMMIREDLFTVPVV